MHKKIEEFCSFKALRRKGLILARMSHHTGKNLASYAVLPVVGVEPCLCPPSLGRREPLEFSLHLHVQKLISHFEEKQQLSVKAAVKPNHSSVIREPQEEKCRSYLLWKTHEHPTGTGALLSLAVVWHSLGSLKH